MVTQDAETGDELARSDLVRGYETQKDEYLVVTDDEFESVRVDSSDTIRIDKFVDVATIDPLWFDAAYYLAPDSDVGADVYKVLREAVSKAGRVALSRVVIARRERAIAIRATGPGFLVHTLHESRELNDPRELFESVREPVSDGDMVDLAVQLIKRQDGAYDPSDFEDRYETRLRAVIAAKASGKRMQPPALLPAPDNVIDLMAALKRSLAGELPEASGSRPAPSIGKARSKPPAARKSSAKQG